MISIGSRTDQDFPKAKKVGMTGFEPAASCSQSRRATKLRYIPYIIQDTANDTDVAIVLRKKKTGECDDRPRYQGLPIVVNPDQ
jgi:hypothetical protein